MQDDDAPVGRILTRREALRLLGLGAAAALGACTRGTRSASPTASAATASTPPIPGCIVRPEKTEGPFFVDERLNRSDIIDGRPGTPLLLAFAVSRIAKGSCEPLAGAMVDVWHCDALGEYSDVSGNTDKFLRGYQLTDKQGHATFKTIYPGWYQGRCVHIHFKIRHSDREFTSQLFFPDETSAKVFERAPYSEKGRPDVLNASDGIFGSDGRQLTLDATPQANGYAATFPVGLQF